MLRLILLAAAALVHGWLPGLSPAAAAPLPAVPGHPGLSPTKSLTQYHISVWTTDDGLPQNNVHAIAQTPDGYLWFGTQEGLARFDGIDFKVFDKRTPGQLENNDVLSMLVDATGVLWIATNGGGLTRYAEGTFSTLRQRDGLASDHVGALYRDAGGDLWAGTREGLSRYRDGTLTTYTSAQGLPSDDVMSIAEDASGTLWVGTGSGLSRQVGDRFEALASFEDVAIWSMAQSRDGALWIGSERGLYVMRGDSLEALDASVGLQGTIVFMIRQDRDGVMWVGTDAGLHRFRNGRFESLSVEGGLSDSNIWTIFQDREGSLWVGTEKGVNQIKDFRFTTFTTHEGLSSDKIWPIFEDRDGVMWIGTEDGLNRYADGRFTVFTRADGLPDNIINALWQSRDGAIWIGTETGGLARYLEGRFETFTTRDGLSHDKVLSIFEDREGRVWVGTWDGVSRYEDGRFVTFDDEDGLAGGTVLAIHQSVDGTLWFGTTNGLTRLTNGQFTTYTSENGLTNDYILALHEDSDGTLWIATWGGGLIRLQDGAFTPFTTRDGMLNDNILQILEDEAGAHLWLGSNVGIFRVAKADLDAYARGALQTIPYKAFDRSDGLRSRECNGGMQPAGWRSRDGRLWFPTMEGIATIDPDDLSVTSPAPPVVISEVRAGERHLDPAQPAVLQPGSNRIEFDYVALSFLRPEDIEFAYQLEGVDTEWIEAGTRRTAYYTNLPPGGYTFKVRGCNPDGICSESPVTYRFEIEPRFYQTGWFLVLCLLLLGGSAAGIYRLRVRSLRDREQELLSLVDAQTLHLREEKEKTELALQETEAARREAEHQREIAEDARAVIEAQADKLREMDRIKTRFFNNISHEFRTPLTLTIGPLENALTGTYGDLSPVLTEQLELMLRNSRRLLRLINQLLDLSKLESGRLELKARPVQVVPFTECVVLAFSAFAQERGLELVFSGVAPADELYLDPEKIEKVIFNLLSNALKFTPAGGQVSVSVLPDESGRCCLILVEDDGPGIPEDDLEVIFDRFHQVNGTTSQVQEGTGIGLSLAKELVELHGGSISVESAVEEGSRFRVALPLGREHLAPEQIATPGSSEGLALPMGSMIEMVVVDPEGDGQAGSLPAPLASLDEDAPTILVVDDNRDIREFIRASLRGTYHVIEAPNGQVGLELARAHAPDLVVSDLMMPVMDGYALCDAIKTSEEMNHIPVILLTAKASVEMKVEGLQLGADDYMSKPFNANELNARIGNLLKLRRQERVLKQLNESLERQVKDQLDLILAERRRYENSLLQAKEQAEASARLKSSILQNMSHEIRTPISAIMGFAQILRGELEGDHLEFVEFIESNGRRLLDTLGSILDLSRLESDTEQFEGTPFELGTAVERVVEALRPQAERKALELHFDRPERPVAAAVDPSGIERVLHNLVLNAIKFTEEGEVHIELDRTGSSVYLRVRDTGVGISADFLPHLFDAFSQASEGADREYEGAGLGLTITRRLVEVMGGEISVTSRPGEGSTFTILFPIAEMEPTMWGY